MEIKYIEDYIEDHLEINKKDVSEYSIEELKEILCNLIKYCNNFDVIQNMILDFTEQFGDVENIGCGEDFESIYTLNIE